MAHDGDGRTVDVNTDEGTAGISRRRVLKGAGAVLAALGAASLGGARAAHADEGEEGDGERRGGSTPRLVLVHGAWADGTGWQEIIPLLEDASHVAFISRPREVVRFIKRAARAVS